MITPEELIQDLIDFYGVIIMLLFILKTCRMRLTT